MGYVKTWVQNEAGRRIGFTHSVLRSFVEGTCPTQYNVQIFEDED
jgi:hypothetical protein